MSANSQNGRHGQPCGRNIPGQPDPFAQAADALRFLSPDCGRGDWVRIGMAVKAALGDAGFSLWDAWSQGGAGYDAKDAASAWRGFKAEGKTTAATLYGLARQAGWAPLGGALPPPPRPTPGPQQEAARRACEQAGREAAARKAWHIWRPAPLACEHPYLSAKRIRGHGARLFKGALIVPLLDCQGALANPGQGRHGQR
jgi:putative DNA primase/helicase